MRPIQFSRAAAVVVAALMCATPAAADPVTVLSGGISYLRSNEASMTLFLDKGRVQAAFGRPSESHFPDHACTSCPLGGLVDPDVQEHFPGTDPTADELFFGFISYDGVTYDLTGLDFTVESDPVRIPTEWDPDTLGGFSSIAQFTLTGLATGRTAAGADIAIPLRGFGEAQVIFQATDWLSTRYRLEDPSVVPEPTTLLLVGSGIAGALARRRKASARA